MKSLLVALLVSLSLLACNEELTVGPSPPLEPPPPAEEEPPPPPPVTRGPLFSYYNVRGVLLFAGTQGSESELRSLIGHIHAQWGKKQLAFNTCSETARWDEDGPWARGPDAFSLENRENLDRFLQVTAEEGVMVRLNIFCTVRDDHVWMDRWARNYVQMVVRHVLPYDHVLLSVANEPYHPDAWTRVGDRVEQIVHWARVAGWLGPMGADDTVSPRGNDYEYEYSNLGFTPDFHPFRNPDPGPSDFRRLVEMNGLPLVISEPTAYSSWRKEGCCTSDKQQIISYFRRAEKLGIVMFYHSTSGLQWPQGEFEWLPEL